jgi:hypothetical protein
MVMKFKKFLNIEVYSDFLKFLKWYYKLLKKNKKF